MLSTDDIQFFAIIAGARSLAEAARSLDVTPPAVSLRLRSLERRLRVQLVNRSSRRLTLTDEGELLALRGRALIEDTAKLTEELLARRGLIAGNLRIVAPLGFGRRFIGPATATFQAKHREMTIELTLSDRVGRAAAETWDIMIHIGALRDSTLRVLRLAPNERYLVASPAYVKQHGQPDSPQDLRRHACLALRENDEDVTLWRFTHHQAKRSPEVVRIGPSLASNDGAVVKSWCLTGCGVMLRSEWDVAEDLRKGNLVRLLPDYRLADADIVALLNPDGGGRARRTQAFLELLRTSLASPPWRMTGQKGVGR
jgi:DNA-binding transcriptional LysR family regulator